MHRDRLKDSPSKRSVVRRVIQICCAVLFNGYAAGFAGGKIFTGKTKYFCVPVLNCYSCPGALGSCPIGSLQAVIGGSGGKFPFYVLGTLMLFGVAMGRLVCGLLCPFGLIQDLISKIPVKKVDVPQRADRVLRKVKYAVLAVFVVILPVFAADGMGTGIPWFCKYICPAGTLEGGIPLILSNSMLRDLAGWLFSWKVLLMAAILAACAFIPRFFCRYICPLGAFYSLFNKFSLCRIELDRDRCISCLRCEKACPMAVKVTADPNSAECIRCGRCIDVCPTGALSADFALAPKRPVRSSGQSSE